MISDPVAQHFLGRTIAVCLEGSLSASTSHRVEGLKLELEREKSQKTEKKFRMVRGREGGGGGGGFYGLIMRNVVW